jgi:hypothetical protein
VSDRFESADVSCSQIRDSLSGNSRLRVMRPRTDWHGTLYDYLFCSGLNEKARPPQTKLIPGNIGTNVWYAIPMKDNIPNSSVHKQRHCRLWPGFINSDGPLEASAAAQSQILVIMTAHRKLRRRGHHDPCSCSFDHFRQFR